MHAAAGVCGVQPSALPPWSDCRGRPRPRIALQTHAQGTPVCLSVCVGISGTTATSLRYAIHVHVLCGQQQLPTPCTRPHRITYHSITHNSLTHAPLQAKLTEFDLGLRGASTSSPFVIIAFLALYVKERVEEEGEVDGWSSVKLE